MPTDTERLNWFELQARARTSGVSFYTTDELKNSPDDEFTSVCFDPKRMNDTGLFTVLVGDIGDDSQHLGQGDTLREAIDAAMRAPR